MRRGRRSIGGGLLAIAPVAFALLATSALQNAVAPEGTEVGERAHSTSSSDCHKHAPPLLHDGFPEPPTYYSRNGKLDVALTASLGKVRIGGKPVQALSYDGSYPGPTLVICAGDHLTVHFKNDLTEPTNLHTHGFHVSPEANHDNVFLKIDPGQSFTYEYDIPQDQPAGSYWYHPHLHMFVEPQIFAGLAGAIVQEGGLDALPALRHVPERWIVIQNNEIKNGKIVPVEEASEPDSRLYVNGVKDPTAKIRPGELQRWRIFNADADRFVVLRLAHGQRFQLLAEDGHTLAHPLSVSTLQIPPGSRREVLVRGGKPGAYQLRAIPFASFPGGEKAANGGPEPNETLLTLRSSGKPKQTPFPKRITLAHPTDLRGKPIDRTTLGFHRRAREQLVSRYGASTSRAKRNLPPELRALPLRGAGETVFWLPEQRALVPGDRLIGSADGGLRMCPASWLRYLPSGIGLQELRELLRPLLDLPIERVLVSHGEPVLAGGRRALAKALE